jgi:protein-disulfide isomerase
VAAALLVERLRPPTGCMVAAPAGTSWTQKVAMTPEGGYLVGNPDAPLKLVEYGSLTCPACARFSEEGVKPLIEKYVASGRVSFEFRSFLIHGPIDLALTRLIGCSNPEAALPLADQVWANLGPIQDRAFADQAALASTNALPANQRFVKFGEITGLYEFFAARGISEDQARSCMADFASLERLAKLSEGYAADGISGTPTFVLNDRKLDVGAWAQLEPQLQRAGAR